MVSKDLRQRFIDFLNSTKKRIDEICGTDEEDPEQLPTPPPPKEENDPEEPILNKDKDQIINDLKENIAKLQKEVERLKSGSKTQDNQQKVEEVKKEIAKTKERIINCELSEEKKQELLRILEQLEKNNLKISRDDSTTTATIHNTHY